MSRKAVVRFGASSLSFVNKGSEVFFFFFLNKTKQIKPLLCLSGCLPPNIFKKK